MDETFICDNCGIEITNENDILDYEDMSVCEYCLHELRMLDEQSYQELSSEGFNDYE